MNKVILNADIGEGVGQEDQLMPLLGAANIACAMHAGSPEIMVDMVQFAQENNVQIGAHPGFDDCANFGRTQMQISPRELRALIQYQLGALRAIAHAEGTVVKHLKLHGALANMAAADEEMATTCYQAALDIDPDLEIFTIAMTAQTRAAKALGCNYKCEIFADRAYNDDASLVDRRIEGAVIHDVETVLTRIQNMIDAGGIIAESGAFIPTKIDTVCVHSDTQSALDIARALSMTL